MKRLETRVSQPLWHAVTSLALAFAAIGAFGFTTITPAKADDDDWRYHHEWREERHEYHPRAGIYFNFGVPQPYAYYYYNAPQPEGYYEYHYYR